MYSYELFQLYRVSQREPHNSSAEFPKEPPASTSRGRCTPSTRPETKDNSQLAGKVDQGNTTLLCSAFYQSAGCNSRCQSSTTQAYLAQGQVISGTAGLFLLALPDLAKRAVKESDLARPGVLPSLLQHLPVTQHHSGVVYGPNSDSLS